MKQLFTSIKKRLNSWDAMSLDETLRLRNNVLTFTLIVGSVCVGLVVLMTIDYNFLIALPTAILVVFCFVLFLCQLFNPVYSLFNAWLFASLGFAVTAFFIWTGGVEGTGILWLYIPPIIAAIVLPSRSILIFYCILMAIMIALLHTPLQHFMFYTYSTPFRICIPISLLFAMICSYVTEIAWHNTHKKLVTASKKLQSSAITDPLTEIYNRRALEMHFGKMNTKQLGLAFAMIDLDFFKRINDSYGHDVGDKTLSHVVRLTRQSIPDDASLYRWGGEEFLLVLRTGNPDDVRNELERLRKQIENNPLIFADGLHAIINITVSIGGIFPNQDLTIEECIRLADVNLYEAKESGRNRVVVK